MHKNTMNLKKEVILVTGGAGFIGSHIVDRFIDEGNRVIVVDWFRDRKNPYINKDAIVHKISIDDQKMRDIFKKERPTTVVHLAAQISVTNSMKNPQDDAKNNIVRSVYLLNLANEFGVKNFIFSSSGGAIYGEQENLPTPLIYKVSPKTPYGISKLIFEKYLLAKSENSEMNTSILRFSNVYGPRQVSEGEAGVISIFLENTFKNKGFTVFGDGSATRDFVYVDDVADAVILAKKAQKSVIANISTGVETSINEIIEELKNNHPTEIYPTFGDERIGDIKRSALNPISAKEELGWTPKTSFKDGVQKTYEWFKKEYDSR